MGRTHEAPTLTHSSASYSQLTKNVCSLRSKVLMLTTPTKVCRNYSVVRTISGFLVVVSLALALMTVKIKGLEEIKAPELTKAPAPPSQNDVSAADALQWRQEFLWHRAIPKVCPNPWIDDHQCARITHRL